MLTLNAWQPPRKRNVYLIDTNVVSEARKKARVNPGVIDFVKRVVAADTPVYLSAVSVGELRRGVELIRHRGDVDQAKRLEAWLTMILEQFEGNILAFDPDAAQVWGRLRVPHPEHRPTTPTKPQKAAQTTLQSKAA